jgi:NAD(P)-dependent dehydrogenase (short-subunit alcohol dehydrogenase family)
MTDEKATVVTGGSYAIAMEAAVFLANERAKIVATTRSVNDGEETEHLKQICF